MISPDDRAAWIAANSALTKHEEDHHAIFAECDHLREEVLLVEERTGEPVATCESCVQPIFVGDRMLGGETPLCGECAPTYEELLTSPEGFVDAEGDPLTAEAARDWYDQHIAAGGKPDDSMAEVLTS